MLGFMEKMMSIARVLNLGLLCVGLSLPWAQAQTAKSAGSPTHPGAKPKTTITGAPVSSATLTANSLKIEGLHNAKTLEAIYVGDFGHTGVAPTDLAFSSLLSSYIDTFSNRCSAELPPDKIPVTKQDCAVYRQPTNRYGAPVGPRSCAQPTRTVVPGSFVAPEVWDAYIGIEDAATKNATADLIGSLLKGGSGTGADGIGNVTTILAAAQDDMGALIRSNGCKSAAVKRLQDNMVRFAESKDSIPMADAVVDNSDIPIASQLDIESLVKDLVAADAKTWVLNQFEGGVTLSSTPEADSSGRLREVKASYDNKGPSGYRGSVTVTFCAGLPSCLYFADDAKACRRPSISVVKAYQGGKYKATAAVRTVPVRETPGGEIPVQTAVPSGWQLHHGYISQREATATASFPATSKSGKTIGSFDVTTSCNSDILSVTVKLSGARGYELGQVLRTSDIQASSRVPLTVAIGGQVPKVLTSTSIKDNTVEISFEGPGYSNVTGSLQGAIALGQLINGNQFVGPEDAILRADSVKMSFPVRHGGDGDLLQVSFRPQDGTFQKFAAACRSYDPAHPPDQDARLTQLTSEVANLLPPPTAAELRQVVSSFKDAVETGNEVAMNDASSAFYLRLEPRAKEACETGDTHACDAAGELEDLRDEVSLMSNAAKGRLLVQARAARLLLPAGAKLKFTVSEKIMADQFTRDAVFDAQLMSPVSSGGRVALEEGSIIHFSGFVSGSDVILYAKELVNGGKPLRLVATQCEFALKSDSSPFRHVPTPGQRPFSVIPGQGANSAPKYVPVGTECSVTLTRPLSRP
jgi:hypothetical protein